MSSEPDVIVVGAGAAGLVAALSLREAGLSPLVIERDNRVGGRLDTMHEAGYTLDRGFQVLQTAYPAVRRWLDLDALGVEAFEPGAEVFLANGRRELISDPLRRPQHLLSSALSTVGSFADKLRVLRLVTFVKTSANETLFEVPERPTVDYLRSYGFSESFITNFFMPFYGGIFLEPHLRSSCRLFLFTFKMFAEGDAVLPKGGIRAIGQQLAKRLGPNSLALDTEVVDCRWNGVTLADGREVFAKAVIDTRPDSVTAGWKATSVLYLEASRTSLLPRTLGLFPEASGVSLVANLSSVQPGYSPFGKTLITVSLEGDLVGSNDVEEVANSVRARLRPWFGSELNAWRALGVYTVPYALPAGERVRWDASPTELLRADGVFVAGDRLLAPTLHHAMRTGELAAEAVREVLT